MLFSQSEAKSTCRELRAGGILLWEAMGNLLVGFTGIICMEFLQLLRWLLSSLSTGLICSCCFSRKVLGVKFSMKVAGHPGIYSEETGAWILLLQKAVLSITMLFSWDTLVLCHGSVNWLISSPVQQAVSGCWPPRFGVIDPTTSWHMKPWSKIGFGV